jgi:response regulator of citrate/malate metabolism
MELYNIVWGDYILNKKPLTLEKAEQELQGLKFYEPEIKKAKNMKISELKQVIKEEIKSILNENLPPIEKSKVMGLVNAKKRQEELIKKGYVLGKDFTVIQDPKNKKMFNISPITDK